MKLVSLFYYINLSNKKMPTILESNMVNVYIKILGHYARNIN